MGTYFVEQKHVVWFGISVEAENIIEATELAKQEIQTDNYDKFDITQEELNDDIHISEEEFNSLTGGK
jgi:hypothetical protein